jgi:hypothetical protein
MSGTGDGHAAFADEFEWIADGQRTGKTAHQDVRPAMNTKRATCSNTRSGIFVTGGGIEFPPFSSRNHRYKVSGFQLNGVIHGLVKSIR